MEKEKLRRQREVETERNRLKSLVSVGITRIFEYDMARDCFMTAKGVDGNYTDERYIDNFRESVKQLRYVLYADWGRFDDFLADCDSGKEHIERQLRLRDRNADYKWFSVRGRRIEDGTNGLGKIIGVLENIDEVKRMEIRQADENKRDPLTKLYRMDYAKELISEFLHTQSESDTPEFAGLLTLNIDNMGILNERMGKAFGDEILRNIATDLDDIFYPTDVLGRVGGDEFVILMKNIADVRDIDKKIREIQRVISRTYVGENVSFGSTVGIGASVYPTDGEDFDTLFDKSEKALFHAKNAGKNCYGFYLAAKEEIYNQYPIEERRARIIMADKEFGESVGNSDSLIELAFKLIDESKDTDSAINLLIRRVARQMGLGGIRIKARVGKEFRTVNMYQCSTVPDVEFDDSDMVYSFEQWKDMLEEYRAHNNLIVCDSVMDIENNVMRKLMLAVGAKACVGCAFADKGEFAGSIDFVVFDGPRAWSAEDLTTVRAVTNVVSSYLLKMKAYEDASDTVERLTGYDSVTGLMTYERFLTMVGEYIESAPHGQYGMVYMDFSNFKYVNETYGYEVGDKILKELVNEAASYGEYYIYGSRVFSDNMVMLFRFLNRTDDEIVSIFEKASKAFTDRMQKEYIDSKLILDIGVCTFEICGRPVPMKNIISNANMARKKAKLPDSPRCIVYNESMGAEMKAEVTYANDMENAFRNHEFVVYLQPKVDLASNNIEGAEALIRWKKQDGTLIFPNDFIPVFEKNKSITLLDYFVYDEVCKYLRRRMNEGKRIVRVSVNVSRVHLFTINELVSYVKSLLTKYEIPPEYLEFELTETVYTDKVDDTVLLMDKLRDLGVKVSMDDFGSGYSSLNVLTKLPLDVLKLDKDFLDDFENDPDEKIIIPSVIDMAKKLNLAVVCEGVETKEQVSFLREVGCDFAQGYFYSKPITQEQFDELLEVV
ncbi:MAG: EAL domain-containing protein [Lachnospiraceae bacterium]|nr:EAL domain-containing protein [Lachnospiraceae bacterium]